MLRTQIKTNQAVQQIPLHTLEPSKLIDQITAEYLDFDGFARIQNNDVTYLFLEPIKKVSSLPSTNLNYTYTTSLEAAYSHLRFEESDKSICIPFFAGFISFEYYKKIESAIIDTMSKGDSTLEATPDFIFYSYATTICYSAKNKSLLCYKREPESKPFWDFKLPSLKAKFEFTKKILRPSFKQYSDFLANHSNFSRKNYISTIDYIKDCISDGDVYQVNLSQQFQIPTNLTALELFHRAKNSNSVPYFSFISYDTAETHRQIISASPELFFSTSKISGELKAICSPIKGTSSRGKDSITDNIFKERLRNSKKNFAELAMIVDLLRNDLGKIANIGSVNVTEHAKLYTYDTLHHLVSSITALLPTDCTVIDLLNALFPCGSITGAPKIAATNLINKLENKPRGVWTGAIGYFNGNDESNFSVAIRTLTLCNQIIEFNSGGGITILSKSEEEYDETIVKSLCWQSLFY
jgi:anthranilate/para-aminobenzoate synthase component I